VIDAVLRHPDERVALIAPAEGACVTYGDLGARVEAMAGELQRIAAPRGLVFLAPGPDVQAVVVYLACLRAGLPICLAEPLAEPLARLARTYRPVLVLAPDTLPTPDGWVPSVLSVPGYVAAQAGRSAEPAVHADLSLLLTTSGSTGSPKLVRLAARNLASNASRIAEYLGLGPGERAIQSLPMHYSYGLSVLNSHLVAGGTVVLTPHSFMRPEFWHDADEQEATSFAGVPYMYETLHRLRFDPARHPSIRTYTQAGGALRRDLIAHFHARATQARARLVIMYGQTEATARISYVPPERLAEKIGSIGIPIPGGRLSLKRLDSLDTTAHELVYEGANVMMGYAESPADLALGDVQRGVLHTGDLGTVDDEGYYAVVGRLKRFAKLFGRRVSLEDVERELESCFPVRAIVTEGGNGLVVSVAVDGALQDRTVVSHLAQFLSVPPTAIVLRRIAELPLTSAGKKDYKALEGAR
jgi:acyl-CoA synthetase (AMP-forming)/AMP-acid ligase II